MANLSFKGTIIMKNLTLFAALMLALVGTANSAGVHTYDIKKPEPVDQHLIKIGYVEVSDGLFQSEGGKGKGFVALTARARACRPKQLICAIVIKQAQAVVASAQVSSAY
jgi:hypothetical protein